MKHTALPWRHEGGEYIRGGNGNHVIACALASSVYGNGTKEGNAKFIVTACNSHYTLVAALEEAKALIGAINDNATPVVKEGNINKAWHILNTALSKAKAND